MKKLLLIFTMYLLFVNLSFSAVTPSEFFVATLPLSKTVTVDSSGVTTSTITPLTGALTANLTPSFFMATNSGSAQSLTFSATCNYSGGSTNAIFDNAGSKYIVLTNATYQPTLTAVNDAKSTTPTPANNSNAIAYLINDPPAIAGTLTVAYNSTNKNWDLVLSKKGQTGTSVTIPAGGARSGTYSIAGDRVGNYQATIILSFN